MVSYMLKGNLQLFGEIQVTRYKDTRYEITLWQQPFYILYLVSCISVSCIYSTTPNLKFHFPRNHERKKASYIVKPSDDPSTLPKSRLPFCTIQQISKNLTPTS